MKMAVKKCLSAFASWMAVPYEEQALPVEDDFYRRGEGPRLARIVARALTAIAVAAVILNAIAASAGFGG